MAMATMDRKDARTIRGKPWRCGRQRGHVLGLAVRERDGVTRLYVFERAITTWGLPAGEETPGLDVEGEPVRAVVEAGRVRCSACGAERKWISGT